MSKRFRNCDLNQRLLLPPSLEELVATVSAFLTVGLLACDKPTVNRETD